MTPRRRSPSRDHLDIETTLQRAVNAAPEVELGVSMLKAKMDEAGWTARTPEGDRTVKPPRLTVRCRDCNTGLAGSAGKDEHKAATGHENYAYMPQLPTLDPTCIDYADPTGDLALDLDRLSEDYFTWQDAWRNVEKFWKIAADIARRHVPVATPHVPACWVETCENAVEAKVVHGRLIYVDMDNIVGHWVARPGARPTCSSHRHLRRAA